jgi:hypothetical protein
MTSNSISRRKFQAFSPSFAVPYRMLYVITDISSRVGVWAAGVDETRASHR